MYLILCLMDMSQQFGYSIEITPYLLCQMTSLGRPYSDKKAHSPFSDAVYGYGYIDNDADKF